MKIFWLWLTLISGALADVVLLNNGTSVKGRVLGLEAGHFAVAESSNKTTRVPVATVTGVDFLRGAVPAKLTLADKSEVAGKVWIFARGAFNLEGPDGETIRIPATTVTQIIFGEQPPAPPTPVKPPSPPAAPAVAAVDTQPGPDKIKLIARGTRVEIGKHCVAGKVTIVDFFAEWCGPCRQIGPILERSVNQDDDLVLRKIDIVRWGSDVADQYKVNGVPNIRVYDRRGKYVGQLSGFNEREFQKLIDKAKAS